MIILIALTVGTVSGLIFLKLKVPGGMMVGAVCGTLGVSFMIHSVEMPYAAKLIAQAAAGAFIGCSIDRRDLVRLKAYYPVALIVLLAFLVLNIVLGFFIAWVGNMDLLTAMLCAVPGGMTDTPLTAADMGADVGTVAILQFIRLSLGIGVFPVWITWLDRDNKNQKDESETKVSDKKLETKSYNLFQIALILCIALFCGIVGKISGVPAGTLLLSMIGTCIYNLLVKTVRFPVLLKRVAQILSGAYIGCSIRFEALKNISDMVIPAIILAVAYMGMAYITGGFLRKRYSIPYKESLLMLTPAGASDMALISADIGVNSPLLVAVQIIRMIVAASVFPQICYWLCLMINR